MRSRRVDVAFAARRPTVSGSASAADCRATSGERLVDKRVPTSAARNKRSGNERAQNQTATESHNNYDQVQDKSLVKLFLKIKLVQRPHSTVKTGKDA